MGIPGIGNCKPLSLCRRKHSALSLLILSFDVSAFWWRIRPILFKYWMQLATSGEDNIRYSSQTSLHLCVGHTCVFFNLIQVDQSKHACDTRVRPLVLHSSKSSCVLFSRAFCA